MSQDRFEELLGLLLDDEISSDQLDELVELVAADSVKLQRLREHLSVSDRLSQYEDELRDEPRFLAALQVRANAAEHSDDFVSQVVASVNDEAARRGGRNTSQRDKLQDGGWQRFRGLAGWVTAAVALLLLAGMVINQAIDGDRDEPSSQIAGDETDKAAEPAGVNDSGVAVLTRVAGLKGKKTADWRVGETIPPGLMTWDAGLVQLEFYCGATVVVEGPANLEILDESRVVCRSGKLRAHVPEPARGFAVLAPTFELVDLGTEFGLDVADDGASEVHVFDGKVELYDRESNRDVTTRRELNAGDALTVDQDGTSKPIATRNADFVTPALLSQMTDARRRKQLRDWEAWRASLRDDPRVAASFSFVRVRGRDRSLTGFTGKGETLDGAIVGCEWSEGRWAGSSALEFKRPGDRVRISVPGEFESLTYSTWLRVDGLDRRFNSLLLTDGFEFNRPHWQIRQDGRLILGIRHRGESASHDYRSDSVVDLFRLGQWVHLVTVYDSANLRVTHFVNGEIATREPLHEKASGLLQIGDAAIGNWGLPSKRHRSSQVRNLNGRIDELVVFGEALEDAEVRRIFEIGRP